MIVKARTDSDRTGLCDIAFASVAAGLRVRVVTVQRSPSPVVDVPRRVWKAGWVGEGHVGVVSTPFGYLVVGGGVTGGRRSCAGRDFVLCPRVGWCA